LHLQVAYAPVPAAGGRPTGVIHFGVDLTARRRAEQALRENEQRLRVTLASIGDGGLVTDTECRGTFLHRVAERLTGWRTSTAAGWPLAEVFRTLDERSRAPVDPGVAWVLREGVVTGLGRHVLLVARDGSERPIDDSVAPIRDAEGHIVG